MALIVNAKLRGRGIFLSIFILPLAISDLAAGLVWQAIFTERGYLNTMLEKSASSTSRTSGSIPRSRT